MPKKNRNYGAWLSPVRAPGSGPGGRRFKSSRPDKVKFCTYILKSRTTGKLYIGQTNNLSERLSQHNTNQVLSTKNKGSWELIFCKEFPNRSDAMKLETKLKKWKNKERIMRWIEKQTMV